MPDLDNTTATRDGLRLTGRVIARTSAATTLAVAAFVLVGWQFDIEPLKRMLPTLVAMNPLTAVAFILASVALWLLADRSTGPSRAAAVIGSAVAAVGLLRLLAYLGGPDVGLDLILYHSQLSDGGPRTVDGDVVTNRMAPNTACLFALLGLTLGLNSRPSAWPRAAAKALALLVALLAMLAVIGYINNVTSLYRPTTFIPIALHTALSFLILAGGAIALTAGEPNPLATLSDHVARNHSLPPAIERYLPIGFGAALLLISLIGIVSYASIRDYADDTRVNDHTRTVITRIAELSAAVHEAESLARTYLVSGDRALLEPYIDADASLDPAILQLHRLTQDDPSQQQRLAKMEQLLQDKRAFLDRAFALRDEQGLAAIEGVADRGDGRRLMSDIRQVLRAMHDEEARLLADRQHSGAASARATVAVIGTGTALAFALVALSGWLVRRDVFLRRRVEAQLRRARDEADAANRIKSEFLANMSHEIRTPMTAIIGYADLLLDPAQTRSDRLNYVNTIRRNGEHLLTIVNDVLDLSKIEAGKHVVDRMPCAPCGILSDAGSLMRVRASEKGLPFEVRTEGPIPETIHSDPTRLRQILINLVGNAIKFTDSGWVRLVVKLVDDEATGRPMLRFDVIDTGIGMNEQQVARLFRPFGQADSSTTRRFGGTGLGLTICKRLAEMLGGRIEVDSSPGRGSTFTLLVDTGPLDDVRMVADCREAMFSANHEPTAHPATQLRGRILLVDDGIDNRQLISVYLRQAGPEVTIAEDGQIGCDKALAAMEAGEPFDLILMDMQMPVLDGYGATARLRAKGCAAPIIAITAHAMAEDRAKCLRAGCTDYLSKPIRRNQILDMLAAYLAPASVDPATGAPAAAPAADSPTAGEERPADDEAVQAFLESYVEGLPEQVRQLQELLDRGDLDRLAAVTHNLKGTGGLYGFTCITDHAADAEQVLRDGESLEAVRRQVDRLIDTLEQVTAEPRRHRPPPRL